MNINRDCGSTHMESLQKAVRMHKADVGIAHDGDGDRTLFCDEKGRLVDGDRIMGMCALDMDMRRQLKKGAVVATVMSNLGLERYLDRHGIRLIRTNVGDRYVVEEMLNGGYNLGGEQSGHIVFLDLNTTGDGPITAVQVLNLMKLKNVSLSKLASGIKLFPQVLQNITVQKKKNIASIPEIQESIRTAEKKLDERGRLLVRPSGTEPKIRVMLEGEDMKLINRLAGDISKVIKKHMSDH
jgi:phosphoglucosamine mutase